MKVMYGARMARFDLLRAVQGLARYMTKWTRRQDQELWRMMCYIKATKHWRLVVWIGDPLQDITPTVFSDSDFAGCVETRRCTSGGFCCLRGPRTSFPISAVSKRQGSMSNSTTEAELPAAQTAVGRMGIPLLVLWSHISEQCGLNPLGLAALLDNTAMLEIIRTGRNLTVRHIGNKTHGVAVSWLHDLYTKKDVWMKYISTTMMAADLYTKAFTEPSKWSHLCLQNNIFPSIPKNGKWDELASWEVLHSIAHRTITAGMVEGRVVVKPENALPPGLEGVPTGFGWHEHEVKIVNICKEPKMLRECSQPEYNLRSTWVRDQDGWTSLEVAVSWKAGHNKLRQNLSRYYERGVTVFQKTDSKRQGSNPPTSSKDRIVSVCIADPPCKARISLVLLHNCQRTIREGSGAKWKSCDSPKSVVMLLPPNSQELWRVFSGWGTARTQTRGEKDLVGMGRRAG